MKNLVFITAAAFVLGTALPALAAPSCKCRFNGGYVVEGATICMRTPNGSSLAKCVKVLNNTSWEISKQPCPFASNKPSDYIKKNLTPFPARPALDYLNLSKS